MRGKAAFASSQAAMEQFDLNATSEVQEVTVLGDWAYIWTQLSVVMTPKGGGEAVKRSGPTLSIFRKNPGAGSLLEMRTCSARWRDSAEDSSARVWRGDEEALALSARRRFSRPSRVF
jgi:ketosteroid isomerase-like protein